MKIAIIGSGISGLTAAYLLNRNHEIEVFEVNDRVGGHTATIDFELDGRAYAIDTGFIVYNDWTYPNFIKLLDDLNVSTKATSMGFSVTNPTQGLEYAGNNLNTLFAQRRNLIKPRFLVMINDILRFNRSALHDLEKNRLPKDLTLGEYLKNNRYSEQFIHNYLVPMGSAIWSMSTRKMFQFPLDFFVRFFKNHGLLNVRNRPVWRVIAGGSNQYIEPLTKSFKEKIHLGIDVSVTRNGDSICIDSSALGEKCFDHVVFATHSDQALKALRDVTDAEEQVLGAIKYESSSVVLHYDESLLPSNRRTWSSWNYRVNDKSNVVPTLTYNMNILQNLQEEDKTFCVTLNDDESIDEKKIIGKYRYSHPQFTVAGEAAKSRWHEVNGPLNTWYCGAYWRNGFHEDGVVSALRVAEKFGESL